MSDVRRSRKWQRITLITLLTGYAGYYVCRSNLSVAGPLLLGEFASAGLTKEHLGTIASVGVLFYAGGKIVNGVLSDYFGGRRLFLLGMFASVLATVLFGFAGMAAFIAIWAANRFFQSMGWVALVKVSSRWYPVRVHATMLGILSMSFLAGDALVRFYLGTLIENGIGWRGVFFVAAATLTAIAMASVFFLKSSPGDVGLEESPANERNVYGDAGNKDRPDSILGLIVPLASSLSFWLVCVLNFGLTFIRETLTFWAPTFLTEAVGMSAGSAAKFSLCVPAIGAVAALSAGVLSDRMGGKHGRVVVPSLVMLIGSAAALAAMPMEGNPWIAVTMLSAASFFLIAPYSFLSGVMALDFGGKRGASTAAGLSDSAGYCGAILSGWFVGWTAQWFGWSAVFGLLAVAAVASLLVAVGYWIRQEYKTSRKVDDGDGSLELPDAANRALETDAT